MKSNVDALRDLLKSERRRIVFESLMHNMDAAFDYHNNVEKMEFERGRRRSGYRAHQQHRYSRANGRRNRRELSARVRPAIARSARQRDGTALGAPGVERSTSSPR